MPSTPRPIRWLHLSDLHYGCRGKALWAQVEDTFHRDVREWSERLGPPDLLLFTGDLAFSGKTEEFDAVDAFLDELVECLTRDGAPEPIVLAVPGNHDVARPSDDDEIRMAALELFDGTQDHPLVAKLYKKFWPVDEQSQRDVSLIESLFPAYRFWFEQRVRRQLRDRAKAVHFSHFPCDFVAEVEPEGAFPLAVVGLNSTWLQYTGGDFDGKLLMPIEQYHAALAPPGDGKPFAVFDRTEGALLLMHHPPSWLSAHGRRLFNESIFLPNHYRACLYGHLHAANGTESRQAGGLPKVHLQSPSLFGVEKWGRSDEGRAFGYSWGRLSVDGELRIWPRQLARRGDGIYSFGHDPHFHGGDSDGILLRRGAGSSEGVASEHRGIDLDAYLGHVLAETSVIEIRGIAGDRSHSSLRPPIEDLYTPLRCRDFRDLGEDFGMRGETVELKELLPATERLLIEGEPGAGKTTFLRLVACMLARDAQRDFCSEGTTWSAAYLGVSPVPDEPRPLPIFLRLAGLAELWSHETSNKRRDRSCLLDLLEHDLVDVPGAFDRSYWRDQLDNGRAWLLLDGLDEVAATATRERLFAVARDAIEHWRGRVVVASRPFQTEAMSAMGFRTATVEPFAKEQVSRFLAEWTRALHREDAGEAARKSTEYRARLEEAILTRPRIRAMARNPVMLTCLCIVHWNRGDLPEVRSRVYEAVIYWLLHAREASRSERFDIEPDFVERALSTLALAAMDSSRGKQSILDLDAAVKVVSPAWARQCPTLDAAACRVRARDWLRFECEHSGVVEELSGNRVRFWHLTFQEYLAALNLARRPEEEWRDLLMARLDDAQWREVTELFVTCLYDTGRPEDVDHLLAAVLDLGDSPGDLAAEARSVGIVGRLLQPLDRCGYRPEAGVRDAYSAALERSMAIFTLKGASTVGWRDRIAAAEALGRGGDPRLQPGMPSFLPVDGLSGELGEYPVTVEEYRNFVDARAYEEARWWSTEGWAQKVENDLSEPGSWEDQLQAPNRPVTEVSWWEAEAYCAWLSDQCGKTIRLPSESEWELAATHPDGPYPWGAAEPDADIANFAPTKKPSERIGTPNVGAPTPVGIYPRGNGPFGHSDLGGNVWEWCSDVLAEGAHRPLRGGCWRDPAQLLRSAIRLGIDPRDRLDGVGFRVLCAPASLGA